MGVVLGSLDIWIDEITPCLRDMTTGQLLETAVFKIESRSFLARFRDDNGWYINWRQIPNEVEVFALVLKEDNQIQGLAAVRNDRESHAAYLHWACTAPHNNKQFGPQKYAGVGGHLFAIAADKSVQWGYEGAFHGFAANRRLLEHYIEVFSAEYLGMLHQYQFFIDENKAQKLLEVYSYEWHNA